jgi:hypothetical protein
MRYMIMFKTERDFEGIPACKDLAQMGVFMQELKEKGVLLATVAGFALVEVPSMEDAVQRAGQFLGVAGEGTSEVREVIV